jgi:hypothetical protein
MHPSSFCSCVGCTYRALWSIPSKRTPQKVQILQARQGLFENAFCLCWWATLEWLGRYDAAGSFFVIRAKSNLNAQRRYSQTVDRRTGLICDQTVVFTGFYSHKGFDAPLRRFRFKDPESGKTRVFLANNFMLRALAITQFHRLRWQIELFFEWIKQHLRITVCFGTSDNAVKTQIWIAVSVYVLVAIVKKRLALSANLFEIL